MPNHLTYRLKGRKKNQELVTSEKRSAEKND